MDGYVGNSADASRAFKMSARRKEEQAKFEKLKNEKEENAKASRIVSFAHSASEVVEQAFKAQTVGLQTREEFAEKRANIEKEVQKEAELRRLAAEEAELRAVQKKRTKKRAATARLSFADDEEEDEEGDEEKEEEPKASKKAKAGGLKFGSMGKNPAVSTGFLPDRDRDREERVLREQLKAEWEAKQTKVLSEILEVTYSYWDGTGHRKIIEVKKGDTIGGFLRACRDQLAPDYREMRSASVENMLYIKEDLIIPHDYTFYWLIVNKARGKSGPLFSFDVHEDIRMINDASKEKDESHAGKVVERHWYDKNKHIFPASRWEIYDPKKDYGGYTIHGGEVNAKE